MSPLRVHLLRRWALALQHAIALAMAEAVVDRLEVVEVDEQHRHAAVAALADGQCVLDAIAEQRAIREKGQRVMKGEAPQLLFHVLAVGRRTGGQESHTACRVGLAIAG